MPFDPEAVRAFERNGWNRVAASYETSFAVATRPFIPALLDAAGTTAGCRVLDVACGPGPVTAAVAERGAIATGVDFAPPMLAIARARHPAITFDQGDAEALPYADGGFDAVVSNFGIHHVPRPVLALREAFRVLRQGGRLAFTIWAAPAENLAWKLLFDAIGRHGDPAASDAPPPGGGFTTAEHCHAALAEAGFVRLSTRLVRATWHLPDAAALLAAMQAGTARMAGLIAAQPADARPAIIADIEAAAAPFRDAAGLALPIAAIVAAGVKS